MNRGPGRVGYLQGARAMPQVVCLCAWTCSYSALGVFSLLNGGVRGDDLRARTRDCGEEMEPLEGYCKVKIQQVLQEGKERGRKEGRRREDKKSIKE